LSSLDRRLAAILGIAVILSTLLVLTIFNAKRPADITLLRTGCPEIFVKESAQKGIDTTFSFAAVSGRDLRELDLRFSVLYEKAPTYAPEGWQPSSNVSLEEIASHIPSISILKSKINGFGGEFNTVERKVEVNGTAYDVLFYDFSPFMALFCDDRDLSQWTSMFALLRRGDELRFFEGRSGFFLDQANSVKYLMVARGENKTEYVGKKVANGPFGILKYQDYPKNEQVSVIFEVMVSSDALPELPMGAKGQLLLQVIQGYADGSEKLFRVNGIPMG